MKKKILKISGVILLLFVGLLVAIPFFFENKIGVLIKNNVNTNINGTLNFSDAKLSLIKSFPNAELRIKDLHILTKAPFEGDTLFKAGEVALKMGLGELFKSAGEPIRINNLDIDRALLTLKTDSDENSNYNLAKDTGNDAGNTAADDGFTFALEGYTISNSNVVYDDLSSAIHLELLDIEHSGSGDLSLEKSELQTSTNALLSFDMDSTNYLNKNRVALNALLDINLKEDKFSFLKNEGYINQLPLVFEGFVQLFDDYQEVNISFKTPSSDFKNFLAVLPEGYAKNIANVETSGNFVVSGEIKGRVDDTLIPTFDIQISSDNASLKYPDLPKAVRNIAIDALVKNTSGISDDTFVEVNKATFMIEQDQFSMTARITELLGNTKVGAHLKANMDLANLAKAYPVPDTYKLKGLLDADIKTTFDMASVERKEYGKTKTSGQLNIRNFEYNSNEFRNPVTIQALKIDFTPAVVYLREMTGLTGNSDFKVNGTINNFLGFMFSSENVEGQFNLNSNTFVLNDFMSEEPTKNSTATAGGNDNPVESGLKIPSFLDCTVNATANTVLYDNLTLKNVKGTIRIRDEKASLSDMSSSIFDGKLVLEGEVSTKETQPSFAMQLGMENFKIGDTFKALDLFQALAPVANALEGKLNSKIDISGLLKDDFTPDLGSVSGKVLAELLATDLSPEKAKVLNALSSKLDFISPGKINLQGLKTALSFENGTVKVKPFSINYEDIVIDVDGGHTFDKKLAYKATLNVPAKYLGKEVNNLIAKIDEQQLQNLSIPVTANIGGLYSAPDINTDLTSGIKQLTTQLVAIQKQKMINQGKDKAQDLIGGLLSGNTKTNDSSKATDSTTVGVKQVLGDILVKSSQKKDTTLLKNDTTIKKKDPVKEAAKDILGGFLGKKKKDTATVKKDSIQ